MGQTVRKAALLLTIIFYRCFILGGAVTCDCASVFLLHYLTPSFHHIRCPIYTTDGHRHRQRYQHKLKHSGHHSTLSDEREDILASVGFVWDSHRDGWFERFQTLDAYRTAHGNCNVGTGYHDASLMVWCKHQRRQYKRFKQGLKSTITEERVRCLESIGFDWNPRNLKSSIW